MYKIYVILRATMFEFSIFISSICVVSETEYGTINDDCDAEDLNVNIKTMMFGQHVNVMTILKL